MGGKRLFDSVVLRELHPVPLDEKSSRRPGTAGGIDGQDWGGTVQCQRWQHAHPQGQIYHSAFFAFPLSEEPAALHQLCQLLSDYSVLSFVFVLVCLRFAHSFFSLSCAVFFTPVVPVLWECAVSQCESAGFKERWFSPASIRTDRPAEFLNVYTLAKSMVCVQTCRLGD